MPNSQTENPFPVRQFGIDKWEVQIRFEKWIACETHSDAKIISNAPILRKKLDQISIPNQAIANKLEKTAKVMEQYNMHPTARYFRAMSKRYALKRR